MFTQSIEKEKGLRGCIYDKKGKYHEIYIKNSIRNIAAFIARASYVSKIELVDSLDCLILDTFGGYLNTVFDSGYRIQLLEKLIPMQAGEVDIPDIEFPSAYLERYNFEIEDYLNTITEFTGYKFKD